MKILTNFFKTNLTHKILPFLGVFLFIFNILLVNKVFAKYDYVSVDGSLVSIPDLNNNSDLVIYSGVFYNATNSWNSAFYSTEPNTHFKLKAVKENYYELVCLNSSGEEIEYVYNGRNVGASSWREGSMVKVSPLYFSGVEDKTTFGVFGDLYDIDGSIFASSGSLFPYIHQDVGDIEVFRSGGIDIYTGTYPDDNTLSFSVYHVQGDSYSIMFSTELNISSSYYVPIYSLDTGKLVKYRYGIFYSEMGNFIVGDTYRFVLTYAKSNGLAGTDIRDVVIKGKSSEIGKETDEIKQEINSGFGELKVEFQESTNKIIESNNKTQDAIKENTETNKNIFQKIGDIFNLLNPFSENFFAYKLVELLLNMLKSLFIPSDDFFNNWLADLNDYFGDRFRYNILSF